MGYASSTMKLWASGPAYQSRCSTGGSRFGLFITVNILFTFYCSVWWYYPFCCCNGLVRRRCFFYLFMGRCGDFFFLLFLMNFPIVISYISALFPSEWLHILPWHGENMLFLLMFDSGETCCSVTACSHWPPSHLESPSGFTLCHLRKRCGRSQPTGWRSSIQTATPTQSSLTIHWGWPAISCVKLLCLQLIVQQSTPLEEGTVLRSTIMCTAPSSMCDYLCRCL